MPATIKSKGKFIVLDILVRDQQGHYYNIEMQVRRYDAWSARSTYYLARTLSNQIVSGQDYVALKPVIGIHLLNFDLFDAPDQSQQAQWCFELRDRTHPQIKLGDELQVHIIEMSKADRLGLASGHLADWVAMFEHWQEKRKMQTIEYPPVQQAMALLTSLSADTETRRLAFARERALFNEATAINAAIAKGELEGMLEGKLEGKLEGLQDALAKMIAGGISEDQARSILGM